MAKAYEALAVLVPFGEVAWFKELNHARRSGNYGTETELKEVLALLTAQDWLTDDNGIVTVEAIGNNWAEREMADRLLRWEALKAGTTGADAARLKVFEMLYTEKGKLIPVKYAGVSGNRRSTQVFEAKVARLNAGLPVGKQLPVIIRQFDNPLDRLKAQVGENEIKTSGFVEMSTADRLLAARDWLQLGGKESSLETMFKRGMSQKLWGIVSLDALWPNVKIVERMCLKAEDPEFIGFGVDKEALRGLRMRSRPETLTEWNIKRTVKGDAPATLATEQEVRDYFKSPRVGAAIASKTLPKETMAGLAVNFPCEPLKKAFKAFLDNSVDGIKDYQVWAVGFNALANIAEQGDYPPMELLLVSILASKNRTELLKQLQAAADAAK